MTLLRWQWLGRVMLDSRLSPYAKNLAFWMAEHANSETRIVFASVKTFARLTGVSERWTQSARKELVNCGWLRLIERKPGPHGTARYELIVGMTALPAECADIKAAMRMFGGTKNRAEMVNSHVEMVNDRAPINERSFTNSPIIGEPTCTRTSSKREPRIDHRHHHRQDGDADVDDGGLASRVEEVFRATVHEVYGDSARPMKPSRVVRREAREYLRAGLSFSELCNVIKEGTRKMAKNGHQAPVCLSALSHNFADALRYLNGARL